MDDEPEIEEPQRIGPRLTANPLKAKVIRHPESGKKISTSERKVQLWFKTLRH